MKKALFLLLAVALYLPLWGQFTLSGEVIDPSGQPVPFAIVKLNEKTTTTDANGAFEFKNLTEGNYTIKVSAIGFLNFSKQIKITNDTKIKITLNYDPAFELDKVIVSATRADKNTPIAYSTIEKPQIEKLNLGQDIPYILKISPSVTVSSDPGTGIGYTYIWIRGTDLTRINVTLNGIPLNDPESHGVWWVDIPDFISSVENIQIQRGVGTSTNGAASFGATINLKTTSLHKKPYAYLSTSYGSFNTLKNTLKIGSGVINNHFTFDLRLSKIHSDGYIDRAWSNLKSFYVSGSYFSKNLLIRAILFSGLEETYQAWAGVPKEYLDTNRTFNPYTYENEIDHYQQTHFQFFIVKKFNKYLTFETALHYTKGAGYYEQYKDDEKFTDYGLKPLIFTNDTIYETDLIRRKWLDNDFYGTVFNFTFKNNSLTSILGGGWNYYYGKHFGRLLWYEFNAGYPIRYQWYNSLGLKTDFNVFWKNNLNIFEKLNAFVDLQFRRINYWINGIDDDLRDITQKHFYNFFNPKFGFLFDINKNQKIYASYGVAHREPKRSDFTDAPANKIPKPEALYDYELGYKLNTSKLFFNLNLYYMDYKDQLIMTGEINDVGAPIMVNVPESYRRGIEIIWGFKFKKFEWNANLTLSQNKILNFTAYIDNWDYWSDPANQPLQITEFYKETDISFSPSVIANSLLSFRPFKNFSIDLISKYVSRQYIDNTSNIERSIDPYFVNDLHFSYEINNKLFSKISFKFLINNILNEKYETYAWVYRYYYQGKEYMMSGYYPQAERNYLFNITIEF